MKFLSESHKVLLEVLLLSIFTWVAYILIQLTPLFFIDIKTESIKNSIILVSIAIVVIQVGQTIGIQLAMSESNMLSFLNVPALNLLNIALISIYFLFKNQSIISELASALLLLIFLFQGMVVSRDYSHYIFQNQKTKYYLVVFIRNLFWLLCFLALFFFLENVFIGFAISFLIANSISRHLIKPCFVAPKKTNTKRALLFIGFATICSLIYRNDVNILRSYITQSDFEFYHVVLTLFSGVVAMFGILAVTFFAPKIKHGELSDERLKFIVFPLFIFNTVVLAFTINIEFGKWIDLIIFFSLSFFILLLSSLISVYLHTKNPSTWVYTTGLIGACFLLIVLWSTNTRNYLDIFLSYLYLINILLFLKFLLESPSNREASKMNKYK
jgi:hypothetical protein